MIVSALVIRNPWIGLILSGSKTWEMRGRKTRKRGPIALIRQGSGLVIGTAKLTDSLEPLTEENYPDFFHKHRVPDSELSRVFERSWFCPWVLENAAPLREPVRYSHNSGAVTFVNLDDKAIAEIARQQEPADELLLHAKTEPEAARPLGKQISRTKITKIFEPYETTIAMAKNKYRFAPEKAQAFGYETADGFVVLAGSTSMREGSPLVKRDRALREKLIIQGVLVPDSDPELLRFTTDYEFSSASQAAGIIKDGNASGPKLWHHTVTQRTLAETRPK